MVLAMAPSLPGLLAAATSKVDLLVFVASAVIVLAGAIGVIVARNPVHSALMLVMTLFGIAVLFVAQEAHFLAAVQVIVYAGAIVVLFLFVIMLLGVDRQEAVDQDPLQGQRPTAIALGIIAFAQLIILGGTANWATGNLSTAGQAGGVGSNVEKLARSIFTRYLLPFEITSALLVIAVIGAVVLARKAPAEEGPV
jgi:NADH-quinone oxidoreductase subunit J